MKPRPGEWLTVYHGAAGTEARPALVFRPTDDGARVEEQPLHAYGFRAVKPGQKIDYKPGDVLYAQLPVNERRVLRWDRSRSRLYRFEVLPEEPTLQAEQESAEGKRAEGVRLRFKPEGGAPRVPDLMPVVEPSERRP